MKTARILSALTALGLAVTGLAATGSAAGIEWSGGDRPTEPTRVLLNRDTGLRSPSSIAFDDDGLMYVANTLDNSVTVYPPDWLADNTAPIRTLVGPSTGLNSPVSLAFDADGQMHVLNANSITVYPANWISGDTKPIRALVGTSTGLVNPTGLALDSTGRTYVTNAGSLADGSSASVTVYAADWTADSSKPVATLVGSSTGLLRPRALTFDVDGYMYVVNSYGVSVYEPSWKEGNTPPTRVLAGPGTGMDDPRAVAFDDAGYMYIANAGRGLLSRSHITVFDPSWASGNARPSALIIGANLLLTDPRALAFDDNGLLYVANQFRDSVLVYQTQTLSLDPLSSVPWNTPTVTASASSSGGLPVTITTNTPDVCSGSGTSPITITIKAMGTCSLEATQEGDERLAPAPAITGSFQVTTAPQTVTVSGPTSVSLSKKWTRVKASTTSGLPVVWTSQTPDVCLHKRSFGQRVQLKATGTCTLSAYQRGNSLWDSAGPETVSFEVTP